MHTSAGTIAASHATCRRDHMKRILATATLLAVAAGCGGQRNGQPGGGLTGTVGVDGSSTVYPVTEAVAEEFQREHQGVRVTVGVSGTGGGFERFCRGETDISNASRSIKDEEAQACRDKAIEYTELKVAIDGLSVMVNPGNDFVDCLTVDQLNQAWQSGSTVQTWRDLDPSWPAEPIKFYGPGSDSGTFDYFTEEINGDTGNIRAGYTASEDDNTLVQGIANDRNSLGFFGYAYYTENRDALKLVAVDGGNGCVKPSEQTIENGTYQPLSRPIFIYVKHAALERPEVEAFATYYLETVDELAADVGYIPLPAGDMQASVSALEAAIRG